jgi:hypothetical protein
MYKDTKDLQKLQNLKIFCTETVYLRINNLVFRIVIRAFFNSLFQIL